VGSVAGSGLECIGQYRRLNCRLNNTASKPSFCSHAFIAHNLGLNGRAAFNLAVRNKHQRRLWARDGNFHIKCHASIGLDLTLALYSRIELIFGIDAEWLIR
jgi:hypothetical protein